MRLEDSPSPVYGAALLMRFGFTPIRGSNPRSSASAARRLQELTDDELIARAPAKTSLSHPHHEMEMQRRLKDSIEGLTRETARARWWAFWGSAAAITALTVVLALKA